MRIPLMGPASRRASMRNASDDPNFMEGRRLSRRSMQRLRR
jgi:hypothetical protein